MTLTALAPARLIPSCIPLRVQRRVARRPDASQCPRAGPPQRSPRHWRRRLRRMRKQGSAIRIAPMRCSRSSRALLSATASNHEDPTYPAPCPSEGSAGGGGRPQGKESALLSANLLAASVPTPTAIAVGGCDATATATSFLTQNLTVEVAAVAHRHHLTSAWGEPKPLPT